MTHSVFFLNGPNANLYGLDKTGTYGSESFSSIEARCQDLAATLGLTLDFRQSNHEGVLVDAIQEAGRSQSGGMLAGVVLNAGAYTHTSVALHDAIKGSGVHVIELHISNVYAREPFRHHSYLSPVVVGVIAGLGVAGYGLAISAFAAIAATASRGDAAALADMA